MLQNDKGSEEEVVNNKYYYMRHYYIIPLIAISILLSGCSKQSGHDAGEQSEFYNIDFVKSLETKQQMLISEIADAVEYIELKTPEDIIITGIIKIIHFGDYLIIKARGGIYQFYKDGQFIRKIGDVGQGPEEYNIVAFDLELDIKKKEVLVNDEIKLLFYDLSGNFLRSQRMTDFSNMGISDTILWKSAPIYSNNQKYKAVAKSLYGEGDTIVYIMNNLFGFGISDKFGADVSKYTTLFYHKNDSLFFKGDVSNDTIWRLSGVKTEPHAFINMGKYKLPIEFERWYSDEAYQKNRDRYWSVASVVEDDNYFFLFSHNRGRDRSKKTYIEFQNIVYNKKEKRGFVVNDDNEIGITDDILGGPPLWPRWSSNDYYMNAVEAHELLEKVEAGGYTPSAQLNELLSRIGEDTNQLIILCRKKK